MYFTPLYYFQHYNWHFNKQIIIVMELCRNGPISLMLSKSNTLLFRSSQVLSTIKCFSFKFFFFLLFSVKNIELTRLKMRCFFFSLFLLILDYKKCFILENYSWVGTAAQLTSSGNLSWVGSNDMILVLNKNAYKCLCNIWVNEHFNELKCF